jgi:putative Mg2+ transporter-C (MgtC) family protein
MTLTIDWRNIAVRLALTILAGTLIGFNRGERDRPAGLRTTILVCLAASLAMIEANLLLSTHGKSADSFVNVDVMRLPLGILTGIGFIGGGAIIRRGDLVMGVTTAATMWLVTVIGLCFGGGQLYIGAAATALAMIILTWFKEIENRTKRVQHARFKIVTASTEMIDQDVQSRFTAEGYRIMQWSVGYSDLTHRRTLECRVRWHARAHDTTTPAFVDDLSRAPDVLKLEWKPI